MPISVSPAAAAQEALRLADADPQRAVEVASRAAEHAAASGDRPVESLAARAAGLASFYLHDLDSAVRWLRRAITVAQRAGLHQQRGEARMTLAYVENWRGRPAPAMRLINLAIQDTSGVRRARAVAQRGAIQHQRGQVGKAMQDYRAALPALRKAGDLLWVQRVLSNRSLARIERRELQAARGDLQEAQRLCELLGLGLLAGVAAQNLGTVEAFDGRIPEALEYYTQAENRFRDLGSLIAPVLIDRADVLLAARLVPEARLAAEQAIADFERNGQSLMIPDARLLLARIAALAGDPRTAREMAQRAAREFTAAGRHEWAALARLTATSIDGEASERPPSSTAVLTWSGKAGSLRPEIALDALVAQARREIARHRTGAATRLLQQASAHRTRGPAIVRARSWYAEALLRQLHGDQRGTFSAARTGLNILDQFAAALEATEMRANVAGHRVDLAQLGLQLALERHSAATSTVWAERGKASHLVQRTVGKPANPALARTLAELRAIGHQIEQARDADTPTASLDRQRIALEQRVRETTWRHRANQQPRTYRLSTVLDTLDGRALIEYVQSAGQLYAITIVDGRHRLHHLGSLATVEQILPRIPFALRRLQRYRGDTANARAAADLVRDTQRQLDGLLFAPLPELEDRPLIIVPTGPLHRLPWALVPTCRGRPLTVVPTASIWADAMTRTHPHGRALVAAGPALRGARAEAEAVAAIHHTTPLSGEQATVDNVATQMSGARIVHLAAHGRVRADNPQFGSLRLSDGPLMVYDLERLPRPPHTLVLAACDAGTAFAPVGDELLGLTVALLAQGSAQLIAPLIPIVDADTEPLMVALHTAAAAGEPPATALAAAQHRVQPGDTSFASTIGFVCFGAGYVGNGSTEHADGRRVTSVQGGSRD